MVVMEVMMGEVEVGGEWRWGPIDRSPDPGFSVIHFSILY